MKVCYNESLGYPQPALFGRGVGHADGTYTPPDGMSYFDVNDAELTHGEDERCYEVTAADTLTPKSQADVDAIADADADTQADNDLQKDRLVRLLFEINFDQENRIRALEGQPPVTKAQYKTALINLYKSTA